MAQRQKQANVADEAAEITTVVSPGIRVAGRIHGGEDIRVLGTIEGSVMLSGGSLHVESSGVVLADVQAESIYVSGIVVGDLTAQSRVVLRAGARVVGDISTNRLIIEAGAAIRGGVATSEEPQAVVEANEQAAEVEVEEATPARAKKVVAKPGSNGAHKARVAKPVLKTPPRRKAKKATKATKEAIRAGSAKKTTSRKRKASSKKKVAPRVPARGKHRAARS